VPLGTSWLSHDVTFPELKLDLMLFQTSVIAVNLVDVKITGPMAAAGCTAGGDRAGIVMSIGFDVPPGRLAVGDRVCAANLFMNSVAPRDGAFQEFSSVKEFHAKSPRRHATRGHSFFFPFFLLLSFLSFLQQLLVRVMFARFRLCGPT
jgi:NADPH:quinone reductase-like Zn-dependent oxidoreductase